jgi:hypothetical protein
MQSGPERNEKHDLEVVASWLLEVFWEQVSGYHYLRAMRFQHSNHPIL